MKGYVIAAVFAFCLTMTLFLAVPTRSIPTVGEYDPWADINDDGKIDMKDIGYTARLYGTTGTAINKTELLYSLQNKITELESRVKILESLHGYQYPINYSDWFSGLVGYWKLDEGSGTTTIDSSGNGNTGILMNGPQWVDGKYGKALDFNGVNNYVSVTDSSSLRVQSFTLAAWIYMTERPYQHGNRHSAIINKLYFQISGTGTHGYKLQFDDPSSTNDNLDITLGDGNAQRLLVRYNSINDLTLNQWHQVVGTWDGSRASIYIDGQLKNSTATEAYTIVHDDTALALGTETTSGVKDVWFNGIIDEAMVYDRSLSAEEVMLHYLFPPP